MAKSAMPNKFSQTHRPWNAVISKAAHPENHTSLSQELEPTREVCLIIMCIYIYMYLQIKKSCHQIWHGPCSPRSPTQYQRRCNIASQIVWTLEVLNVPRIRYIYQKSLETWAPCLMQHMPTKHLPYIWRSTNSSFGHVLRNPRRLSGKTMGGEQPYQPFRILISSKNPSGQTWLVKQRLKTMPWTLNTRIQSSHNIHLIT
jgi:hypothetical protein